MAAPQGMPVPVKWKLTLSSAVLIARDVNQSIFKPAWLLNQGILLEGETDGSETVFAPGITRVATDSFELLVLPDRIQLRLPPDVRDGDAFVTRVLGGITRTLPHTPFSAVGLNNQYEVCPTDAKGFFDWNRRMFASPWALAHTDDNPRNRFGCSFAFDAFDGARMRVRAAVTAAPGTSEVDPEDTGPVQPYLVNLHCNLHRDLPASDTIRELSRMLSLWKDVRTVTQGFAEGLSR